MLSRCFRVKTQRKNKKFLLCRSGIFKKGITDDASKHEEAPTHARVVVCGGGVMGASVAYHLAKLGWGPETVLIEQNRFVFMQSFLFIYLLRAIYIKLLKVKSFCTCMFISLLYLIIIPV